MTSPIAKLTPQNAPRDQVTLTRSGRFALRTLARDLNMIGSDDQNVAFMGLTTEKQAEEILKVLQMLDRSGGAPAPQQAPPAQTNGYAAPQQMAPQGFPPAAQPPQQMQPAPEATPSGKPGLKRSPRNGGQPAPEAPAPQQQMQQPAPQQMAPAGVVDLTPVLNAVSALETKVVKLAKSDKDEVLGEIEHLRHLVSVSIALTMVGLQQNIEASTQDLITAALDESPGIQDILVTLGKAKKKG